LAFAIFAIRIPSLNKNCLSSYAAREELPAVENVSHGIPDVTRSTPSDGIYGSKTLAAVKWFQSKNGLTVDGIAGTKTLQAMGIYSSSTTSGSSSTNSNDVNLLARLVYGEARGEPYAGQVAVAAVVLNRVKSSSFPNTIAGVIYQKGAFNVVDDGQINLSPNSTAKKAAQDALNGWDPSYGAIYYFNPNTATNKWIWSRPMTVTIGKHRFCK